METLRERLSAARPGYEEVDVNGRTVRYQVVGTGQPLILVHGLSGSSRWWWRNIPALADEYSVYMVDLPGFGAMRRDQAGFVLSEAADWLADWIEQLGIAPVNLLGHSLGGFIVTRLAARYPHLVNRLVLVAPAGVPEDKGLHRYLWPLLKSARFLRPRFATVLAQDFLRAGPRTILRAARELLSDDIRRDLRAIRQPTLLVWGTADPLIPSTVAEVFRSEIPQARLITFPDTSHVPMIDRADDFNRAVLAFLRDEKVRE